MGDGREWHSLQDVSVDERITVRDESLAGSSAVFRVWYWGAAEIFNNAHLVRLHALRGRGDSFRVLDLGCGTGEVTREIGLAFPKAQVVGLDSNSQSIELAVSGSPPSNVSYVEGVFEDARSLGAFDVVVCSEVFEHVEQPAQLLATTFAVLKPGGYLSFSTPSGWMWRRPGLFTALALLRGAADPPLRARRRPAQILRGLQEAAERYRRLTLHPERSWREALPSHPAVQPKIMRTMLEEAGFRIELRTSSLWHLDPRYSVSYRLLRANERRSPIASAHRFFHVLVLLEALVNLAPPLRVFESRQLFLARKPG